MTARLIDGRAYAAGLRERVAEVAAAFREKQGRAPGLAVVLVGEHPPSAAYVRSKAKATVQAGMESFEHKLPADVSQGQLMALVDELNADPAVDGILVQLPLPKHVDELAVLLRIDPDKDVDGFHPMNAGRLAVGLEALVPCTPLGCLMLLQHELGDLSGMHAIVVARSNIVGKPTASLLVQDTVGGNATVTIAHSRTKDLAGLTRQADILIVAIGKSECVTAPMVRPGAVVIDVGINRVPDPSDPRGYRLTGDVAFEPVRQVASAITPVPGGVGKMTIAMLLSNTVQAARQAAHRRERAADPALIR